MKLSRMQVLSDSEIRSVHEATIDILCECGMKVPHDKILSLVSSKGITVDTERSVLKFTRGIIEDSISRIPAAFDMFNRKGEYAFTLGDRVPRFAAGHNAVFWVDSKTGKTRPSTVEDVAIFSRICENLAAVDMLGIPVMPQDVAEPGRSLVYGVRAAVENCTKPIYFSTDNVVINRACADIMRAAFNGDMKERPYCISQLSTTSPLAWETNVLDAVIDTLEMNIPLCFLPEPIAGISAPYSLAGLLTVHNCECIGALALVQIIKPGAKVMYGSSWTASDMRSGAALVGSTETSICRIAGAQMGMFYNVPLHTTAPNSDNHAHDEQNAWEKTLSAFCAAGAGNDLIVNCGMFATGMTCSHEQLIMDAEMAAMVKRIVCGMDVSREAIAADVIKKVGPMGNYMTEEHTLGRLGGGEFIEPIVSVRGPFRSWELSGCKDSYRLAREMAMPYFSR